MDASFKRKLPKSQLYVLVKGLRIKSLAHLQMALFPDPGMEIHLIQSLDVNEHNKLEC